jgi:murein DD-endopeptidase MepM/ murein hydrolase activator NlpD
VTGAVVGAGLVAIGVANMPDAKSVDPSVLADLQHAAATDNAASARAGDASRASRGIDRSELATTLGTTTDVWALPLTGYDFTAPYGVRWGELHSGIDLSAQEGTPYNAIHAGVVTKAGWYGGYGYCVIVQHPDGSESIYGHSSQLLVKEGQQVKAGDKLGLVGNTGHSYGSHLHLEIHVNGAPIDPVPWLGDRGVDIKLQTDNSLGAMAAS